MSYRNWHRAVALAGLASFVLIVVAALVARPLWDAPGTTASAVEPALAQALRDMTFGLLALSGIPTAVCLGAYAEVVLRSRSLPAWTAWLAGIGAVAHVLIAASFVSHGAFLSVEGSVIYLVPGTF